MQKKLIALAVAAAFSTSASADVGFYGIVDGAVAAISAKGQKSDFIATSGAASTSRLGVKATEDLGSGLTAVAVVEYGIDTQAVDVATGTAGVNSAAFTSRQKMLAVAGDFGTVATGYLQTAAYDFLAKYDPIYGSGSSAHSIAAKGHLVGSTGQRAQRAVAYISPNISGLTLAVNYVTALGGLGDLTLADTTTAGLKTTAYMMSANYTLDALSIGAVYAAATDTSSTPALAATAAGRKTSEFAFGGSYDLGVAKLMGTFQSSSTNATDATKAKSDTVFSMAGVVPVPTGAFAVMYAQNANASQSTATISTSAKSATALTAGYLHTFTKSTTGYVVFSTVKNGASTSGYSVSGNALAASTAANWVSGGGDSTLFGVGLRKKF
jgi:predicted porin